MRNTEEHNRIRNYAATCLRATRCGKMWEVSVKRYESNPSRAPGSFRISSLVFPRSQAPAWKREKRRGTGSDDHPRRRSGRGQATRVGDRRPAGEKEPFASCTGLCPFSTRDCARPVPAPQRIGGDAEWRQVAVTRTGEPQIAAVDEQRMWRRHMEMATLGATPAGGVTRPAAQLGDAGKLPLRAGAQGVGLGQDRGEQAAGDRETDAAGCPRDCCSPRGHATRPQRQQDRRRPEA